MVAQLEHQFRLGRLSLQGLWFYCQVWICLDSSKIFAKFLLMVLSTICFQPMMGSMQALSTVIQKASANDFSGSAVLNLLQNQVKLMLRFPFFFNESDRKSLKTASFFFYMLKNISLPSFHEFVSQILNSHHHGFCFI